MKRTVVITNVAITLAQLDRSVMSRVITLASRVSSV